MIYRVHGAFGGVVKALFESSEFQLALAEFIARRNDGWHCLVLEQVQAWTVR